jgi:dihydroorotase
MRPLLIRGGRVIDPAQNVDEVCDLLVAEGKIKKVGKDLASGDYEVIHAEGMVVCPGFIDLHCHLRQPGYEYKETIASGARAAARGGFTTVCCMPNTNPPLDNKALVSYVQGVAAREASMRILPIGCITRGRKGEELADLAELAEAGVVGFSDDGSYVQSARLMRQALEYSRPLGLPLIQHAEDRELAGEGVVNEGSVATRLGLAGIPNAAEDVAVARDIILAEITGAWIHVAHVSTAGAVEAIRQAKRRGVRVTAEVTPHHLTLTQERALNYNTQAKVNPPLRTQKDIETLLAGLVDGTLDIIATDHAPHAENDKRCEFAQAASGISGLETALSTLLSLTDYVKLPMLLTKLTCAPAKILGGRFGQLGTLAAGAIADITLFDPAAEWVVEPADFASKGKNTPLAGETLKGRVKATIYGGKVIYRDEGKKA